MKVAAELGQIVIPILNTYFKGDQKIIHTECLDEWFARLLDQRSGIDAIMTCLNDISGVALRMQTDAEKNYRTFTIRYSRHTGAETEWVKRLRCISQNKFYPHYTCQAYLNNKKELLGGAFVSTKELYIDITKRYEPFSENRKNVVYLQRNGSDDNYFIVVPYHLFPKNNILIFPQKEKEIIDEITAKQLELF